MMITISVKDLTKSYGVDTVLDGISFNAQKGEKIGIVGPNGAGKTTLMRILSGESERDSGEVFIREEIGYLTQNPVFDENLTVHEAMSSAYRRLKAKGRDDIFESMIAGTLRHMAFPESSFDMKVKSLSGGEKTRLSLAVLMLKSPPVLLLDEPTNHLDLGTLAWLERYLKEYRGTMLVVSHDRYFLDEVTDMIYEIENHRLKVYKGSYTQYAEQKRVERKNALAIYENQQAEIKRQEEMIRRFRQHKTEKLAKRARSREKRLDQIERIEKPEAEQRSMKIGFRQNYKSGTDVLKGEDLSKSYDRKMLFEHVSFDIKKGERIAMVGANGIGKTTLLKIIDGETLPDSGELKYGHNVQPAYYDQEQETLDPSNTLVEELSDSYRLYSETDLRKILGRFLFTGDVVFSDISTLSGGEKARLSLLKLMLSGANVLLLDEPTNHLDIQSKEIFEEALLDYPGTVIAVSHDRYFLRKIPSRIVELNRGGLVNYLGSYDYYNEKKGASDSGYLRELRGDMSEEEGPSEAALQRKIKKLERAEEKRRAKREAAIEAEIEVLERRGAEIEKKMCSESVQKDHMELVALSEELTKTKESIEKAYEEWHNIHIENGG